jgi:hypothetical protein
MPSYIARLVNSGNGDEEATYEFEADNDEEAREEAGGAWRHLHIQIERRDEETGFCDELDGPYVIVC